MILRALITFMALHTAGIAQPLQTVIQQGHELAVLAVAVSPDGNFIATGSKDKTAKLWEISTGREVRSFMGHQASVTALAFASDGKILVSGGNDKYIRLWNVETGTPVYSVLTGDYITSVQIDPQNRFFVYAGYNTSGYGDTAYVVDMKTKAVLAKLTTSPDKGLGNGIDISISSDGKWLALGEDNRMATLYETSGWKKVNQFTFEEGFCGGCGTRVHFSPDHKQLFMVSNHGPLQSYDVASGKLVKVYKDKFDNLSGLSVSNDGKKIAVTVEEKLFVYDVQKGIVIDSMVANEKGKFHRLAFSTDSKKIYIASDNNTAIVWNVEDKKTEKPLTGFLNARDDGGLNYDPNFYWQSHIAKYVRYKNALRIANDGKTLIKGKFGAKVKRWDIATGKSIMEYIGHKKAVLCYDLSRDGTKLITGGGDGKIMMWDLRTGDSLRVINSYREPIFDIHFSNDETKVVTSSWDATMKIHELTTGKLLSYFKLDNASAYSILFHPTDLYVFTARLDNSLQMWETDTKTAVRNFVGHTDIISCLALARDQKTLLSAGWDGSLRLWDVGTGLMTRKFVQTSGPIHTAIFSEDEKFIYAAGADRVISIWHVATGKIEKSLTGHNAEITSLLLSPDNKMLISHSLDGVTKFWDLNSGKEFFEHIHLGDRDWLVKNPEGYFTGTDEARKHIHFVSGVKTYSVDQFFHEFYRPDLLPKFFQSRGSINDSKGIPGKLKNSPPPTVKIALLPVANSKTEIHVRVTDNGAGVGNLKIMHNGKGLMLNPSMLQYPSGKDKSFTYRQEVALIGGNNIFEAVASNNENIESDSRSVEIFTESEVRHSTCYIFCVGINEYKNTKLNLNYAKRDAVSFSDLVNQQGTDLFQKIEIVSLFDGDATRQKILAKMDDLANVIQPEDVFVFYYAGHGSMVDNRFFFIPTENSRLYDQGSLQKEAIEASVLQEKLKSIKALKQLIVMDACQSGGSVELLAARGASEEKAIAQLSRSAGIHVMASAGSEQFATEFSALGHGLFTYVLIKGLQGAADGSPKDGKVTIYELKSYIDDQVPEMTKKLKGKPQYPYTFSRGQDFPVVLKTTDAQ